MISFSTFKSAVIDAGQRILKVVQYGAKTAAECMPFGDDSNPVANMQAIYATTENIAEPVIIGYLNTQQLAGVGEKRLYSVGADGSVSFYAWLKNDGTLQLGGDVHNLVRYAPLNIALQQQDTAINAELAKIATAIGLLGGSYTPNEVSTDISGSKINEIKCL